MAAVLVVDDDPTVREVVITYLTKAGHTVTSAADGHEALASVAQSPPELVVLDLMLPGVDGLEVCRRLRESSDIPVIMLTAKGTVSDRVVGLSRAPTTTSPSRSARASSCCASTRCCAVPASRAPAGGPVQSGDLVVDPGSRVVTRDDEREWR